MHRLAYPIEEYKWVVRCYYKNNVKPPRIPGEPASETFHVNDFSKDLEVEISEKYDVIVEINPLWRGW